MTISISAALGIGSGLDITKLVADLAAASKAPKEALLARREAANQAKVSSLAEMTGAIDSFASALSSLISGGSLFTQPSVSDTSIISASTIPGNRLNALAAELEVIQLAKAQTVESVVLASRTTAVGQGQLTLNSSTGSFIVTIDASNDSLEGLAKAINDSGAGLTATVVVDTAGARLVLKGKTGAAETFTVDVPDGTASGLERFAYGAAYPAAMTEAQAAQDARFYLDGVELFRSTNSFKDLIAGVEINLKRAAPGSIVALGISRPTESIKQAVNDFATAYNALMSMVGEATKMGVDGAGGPLRGDLGVREMQRQLRALPTKELVSSGTGPRTLAEIGVRTNRDGTLSVDTAALDRMLASDPAGVEALFNPTQYSSDPNVLINSPMGQAKPGTYLVTDVVAQAGAVPASGLIDGLAMTGTENFLVAPFGSKAIGLVLDVRAAAASVTITIEPGFGGALQAIRDSLRSTSGPFASSQDRLSSEAKNIAEDRAEMESRHQTYYNQLLATFTAMERQVSSFKATQSYLDQQVKMWTNDRD